LQVTVLSCISEAKPHLLDNHTVIVIDVLRATSNMITAMMYGCKEIVPLESIEAVKKLSASGDLLGGERNCQKIVGFDFGNSPFEYMTRRVEGKRLWMTTTNGTRIIQRASQANHVLASAFLNARACAAAAYELNLNICILCSGTNDIFSWEDGLCAGLLVDELRKLKEEQLAINDFGLCMHTSYLQVASNLTQALLQSANGKKLTHLEFEDDIAYCAKVNITDTVPSLFEGTLIPYRSKTGCPS
jgi:2-phosphosulfolactate phosphatase